MLFTQATYIGIDPTAGQRPYTYAALDAELNLLALGAGGVDEICAFAGGQRLAVTAVCAPRQPNQGLMSDSQFRAQVRMQIGNELRSGRYTDMRLADFLLTRHSIPIPRTPADGDSAPGWMRMGFHLHQRLQKLGYAVYPQNSERTVLETYPHAVYCALLERPPFPKHTLEGRIQRQLALHSRGLRLADPMDIFEEITRYRLLNGILPLDDLLTSEELDALAAAYTAWCTVHQPDAILAIGDSDEGQIILPVSELKAHYV